MDICPPPRSPAPLNTTGASDSCRAARGLRRLLAEGQGVRCQEQDGTCLRQGRTHPHLHRANNKIQKGSPKEAFWEWEWDGLTRGWWGVGRRGRHWALVWVRMSRRQESPGLSKCVIRTPNRTHSLVTGQPPSGSAVSAGVMASAQCGVGRAWPALRQSTGGHPLPAETTNGEAVVAPPFCSTHSNPTFLNKMFSAVV